MSRRTSRNEYRNSQWLIAAVYLLLIGVLAAATAKADTADSVDRSSVSQQYSSGGRAKSEDPIETRDRYAPLVTQGPRKSSREAGTGSGQINKLGESPVTASAVAGDFWIYEADVVLFGDDDDDGFFYGIDLLFDADTIYSSAAVYAVLYLSLDGGPWNEYAITDDFRIDGARADDEYVIVTELESGYPTGDYDLLIELFSANSGEFLADFGPEASSALSFLPLEDFNRDAPAFDTPVTVSRGSGGGAMGFWTLLVFAAVGLSRIAGRRRVSARRGGPCA